MNIYEHNGKRFVKRADAAGLLGVHLRTIERWIVEDDLACLRIGLRRWVDLDALQAAKVCEVPRLTKKRLEPGKAAMRKRVETVRKRLKVD